MYYPLLRARQFELITLRELANENQSQGKLLPILEPVKESLNNLRLAYEVFEEKEQACYLILNPSVGEMHGDSNYYADFIADKSSQILKPAFIYRNNSEYILNIISEYSLTDCLLICQNDIDSNDSNFQGLVQSNEVGSINVFDPSRNRDLNRFLRESGKTYIRQDDLFEKQARNSDFLSITEHRFSEEHKYFSDEGFSGFSDYTVLPSEFSDGGSTPRAVAIHLTYMNASNQIWIRHFTSDTNDSIANVQGKFAEAARKAVEYCIQNNLSNSAIEELKSYYDDQHYPGLGTVKKIAIKNHLLVVIQYLTGAQN